MQNSNQYKAKGCKPVLPQPNAFALGKERTPHFEGCKPDIIISTNNNHPNYPEYVGLAALEWWDLSLHPTRCVGLE